LLRQTLISERLRDVDGWPFAGAGTSVLVAFTDAPSCPAVLACQDRIVAVMPRRGRHRRARTTPPGAADLACGSLRMPVTCLVAVAAIFTTPVHDRMRRAPAQKGS